MGLDRRLALAKQRRPHPVAVAPPPVRANLLQRYPRAVETVLAVLVAVAAWAFYRNCEVPQLTDSKFALVLSESLLHRQTTALDGWLAPPQPQDLTPGYPDHQAGIAGYPYQIEVLPRDAQQPDRPRIFLWYPNFGSVLAVPAVAWFNFRGLHAVTPDGQWDEAAESEMQLRLAAALCGLAIALTLLLARLWLPVWPSLAVATAFCVASPLVSTGSRALWTSTWTVVLTLALLLHVGRASRSRGPLRPWLAGSLCAALYLTRPALVVEVAAVMGWLVWHNRRQFWQTVAVGAVWAAALVAWSMAHFGAPLPSYFRHAHLEFGHFWSGLYGAIASPSRGLLVYTPFLVVALVLLWRNRMRWPDRALVTAALGGTLAHALLLAVYPNWWGGHSFGARLMLDTLPLTALWVAVAWAAQRANPQPLPALAKLLQVASAVALVGFGAWMHQRGATERATFRWNSWPIDIEADPARALDWRLPQFMAGLWPIPPPEPLPVLQFGQTLAIGTPAAQRHLLDGWGDGEGAFRWTDGSLARLCFALPQALPATLQVTVRPYLDLRAQRRGPASQRLQVQDNGQKMADFVVARPGGQILDIPLLPGQDHVITLLLQDAAVPLAIGQGRDTRRLALAVHGVTLRQH